MHGEAEYSFSNYRKIKLSRHRRMFVVISVLYVVMQTLTVIKIMSNEYGLNLPIAIASFGVAITVGGLMYLLRYQLDYAFYKLFFSRSQNGRFIYTHSQLLGPLLVYLTVYGLGIIGIGILVLLARPGTDYQKFKSDVLVLNQKFVEINTMISDLVSNPEQDNSEEVLGFIKYNINMFNVYEIALFDNQAKIISYEQLLENIKG